MYSNHSKPIKPDGEGAPNIMEDDLDLAASSITQKTAFVSKSNG